jgi:hypothetical protein
LRQIACIVLAFVLPTAGGASGFVADKQESPQYVFVKEYIRELDAIEKIRSSGTEEQNDETKTILNAIHTCALLRLELQSQVQILKRMHLKAPFEDLIPTIAGFYEAKIRLYQDMINIDSSFLEDPKPGADYGRLAAEMPQVRARLDFIDQSLFEATPTIFMTLIDRRPDSKNHLNHLIITKAERAALASDLYDRFGTKLDEKDQSYTVGAAAILREGLLKDYKCSDDPWK